MSFDTAIKGSEVFCSAGSDDGFDSLSDDLRVRVKGELEPGERLIWAERSNPPLEPMGTGFYVLAAIAAILMVLGTIGMTRQTRRADDSAFAFGLIAWAIAALIVIGLPANVVSRFKKRRRDAAVCYAITDRRGIIWTPEAKGDAVRIRSFPRGEIRSLVRIENPDGSGSVLFGFGAGEAQADIPMEWHPHGFFHVAGARRVELIARNNLIGSDRSA